MPEYYSDRSHSSSSPEINIYRNSNSRAAKYRRAKYGKPELTEEEKHQKLLDEFGKRLAATAEFEAIAPREKDAPVKDQQKLQQKPTQQKAEHSHQVEDKQSHEQPQKSEPESKLKSNSRELKLEQIISPLITQGEKVYKQNDYQSAYDIFSQVVALQPDNSYALFHLSSSANQTKRYIIAVETAQKLIDSNQYTAQAYYFQAQSLEKMGRLSEAASAYQKAGVEIAEARDAFMRLEQDRLLGGFSNKPALSSDADKSSKQDKTKTTEATSFSHSSKTRNTRANSHSQPTPSTAQKAEPLDVGNLTQVEKLLEAVNRGARQLPDETAEKIKALFSPATLAMMMAVFAVYMAASLTGFSQGLTIGMGIAGVVFFGLDAVAILEDLAGFASAVDANTEKDLDEAGKHLASLVAMVGVDTIMTLLSGKVAQKIGKSVDNLRQVDEVHAHSADNLTAGRNNPGNTEGVNQSSASAGRTEAGLEPQTVPTYSQLDNVATAQRSQYLEAIANAPTKGEKLLEFGNFGSPERFKNVLNALDSVDDVERLKRVFNEDYLNSLGEKMAGRYRRLLDDIADGNSPPVAKYAKPLSFSERLKVLDEVETVKTELAEKTKNAPANVLKKMRMGQRNIAYGSYKIELPNSEVIEGNFVSRSAKTSAKGADLLEYTGETLDDGRTFVPDFPKKRASKFFEATEDRGANDSERKALEYIMGQIKSKLSKDRISFKRVEQFIGKDPGLYEGQGFSGKITINSEMTPCSSCENVIAIQFKEYFGNDIAVEVKYGVEYIDSQDRR